MPEGDNVKLIRYTNFDATDEHFEYSSLFSDAQVEKVLVLKKWAVSLGHEPEYSKISCHCG